MVRAPEYEEMDRARADTVPRAFREVFGSDKEFSLKEEGPFRGGPIACGPIARNTYHIFRNGKLAATVYQNGHIEILDESITDRLKNLSEILEAVALQAYNEVKRHSK